MSTNGINQAFLKGIKIKLGNHGANSSGITFELKSVFDEMAKQGIIKDKDAKGLTKQDALNMYTMLNKIHQETGRDTNYTRMKIGKEFEYTADEIKALAEAAGYEIVAESAQPNEPVVHKDDTNHPPEVTTEPVTAEENHTPLEIAGPPRGENPSYDAVIDKGYFESGNPQINIDKSETGSANNPDYEMARLSLIPEDFNLNGQIGKTDGNGYYINGVRVTEDVYNTAKTKAMAQKEQPKTYTDEEIKQNIENLKPGETFSYQHTEGSIFKKSWPIMWRREEDGTLTQIEDSFFQAYTDLIVEFTYVTKYSPDRKKVLQRITDSQFLTYAKELTSTINYGDDGFAREKTTDLSSIDKLKPSSSYANVNNINISRVLSSVVQMKSGYKKNFESFEFKNSKGETVVLYKEDKLYDAEGKEISFNEAYKILSTLHKNNNLAQLVSVYKQ